MSDGDGNTALPRHSLTTTGHRPVPARRAWRAFRRWRRARPFWAGVFLLAAGAELLLIPLPVHAMGLILHIGTGGVLGILIGAVLMVCALLLWVSPAQRAFYSIVAVLLAISALVASNLGGFLIGTLLGVLGGSLGFGWTPQQPGAQPARRWPRRTPAGDSDLSDAGLSGLPGDGNPARASVLPLVLAAAAALLLTHAPAAAAQQVRQSRPAQQVRGTSGCVIYIPVVCPKPTPSPTRTGSPSPAPTGGSPTPAPPGSPGPVPSPTGAPPGRPAPGPGNSPSASPKPSPRSGSAPAFAIATVPSGLTASSAVIKGFAYDGLATVPTANGNIRMMQFSMTSITLAGMQLVAGSGTVLTTRAPTVALTGAVTLYATRLSGKLAGIPIAITPDSPLAAILKAIAPLTKAIPVPMTDVDVSQPFTAADGMTITGLRIS